MLHITRLALYLHRNNLQLDSFIGNAAAVTSESQSSTSTTATDQELRPPTTMTTDCTTTDASIDDVAIETIFFKCTDMFPELLQFTDQTATLYEVRSC
jgi:hypothetical protein